MCVCVCVCATSLRLRDWSSEHSGVHPLHGAPPPLQEVGACIHPQPPPPTTTTNTTTVFFTRLRRTPLFLRFDIHPYLPVNIKD